MMRLNYGPHVSRELSVKMDDPPGVAMNPKNYVTQTPVTFTCTGRSLLLIRPFGTGTSFDTQGKQYSNRNTLEIKSEIF